MNKQKHALVLFTKYPEPGLTKTRLMEENGGSLTAQEAADLYRAMCLDTATVALSALERCRNSENDWGTFIFYISSPAEHMPKMKALFDSEVSTSGIQYIVDRGRNFDEHFNSCYQQLFEMDYDTVICIGGDLPAITPDLICRAFSQLIRLREGSKSGAMAIAPCQAGGVSLVGTTKETPFDFTGVFYNQLGITTLDALVHIAEEKCIPLAIFEALFDVDYGEDLGHMISVINAMEYAAQFQEDFLVPIRTLEWIHETGLVASSPPNEASDPRSIIDA
ncbi:hypothetical protein DSCO28_16570 [Desulfosarcina ovata subsp. sediminis]|uniref:Glycosyl transferase n=1 Tax=Desulfosarcina ovata subsp. sediminis TaxID=885957 RepID=A0A5K7ZJN1_9BACT|nr:DUF2064 domain-containing protein [Desulfosarcina ovata]BBO81091.1 hypothetical protein DSCO28_16570 [Desulfosarcina ovata subsp. sediminis]